MSAARPITVVLLAASFACASCSPGTRHRALRFFFDGVPEPEAKGGGAGADGTADGAAPAPKPSVATAEQRVLSSHAPYRENRCGVCHDGQTGELFRSAQEGLCSGCHEDVPPNVRYVHGPVAVRDCLFCHHYHGSSFPSLMLSGVIESCLRCHDRADLSTDAHPAEMAEIACTNCHDAHGGGERYFLK